MSLQWSRLPTEWILEDGLHDWKWGQLRSSGTAALQLLIAISHLQAKTSLDGWSFSALPCSYDEFTNRASMSRTQVSNGLNILESKRLITVFPGRPHQYKLEAADFQRWGKVPYSMITDKYGAITPFKDIHQRKRIEFDALKLYLLLIAMRDSSLNSARASYVKIQEKTGLNSQQTSSALSWLCAHQMVSTRFVEPHSAGDLRFQEYFVTGIEGRRHRGTRSDKGLDGSLEW